MEVGINTGEVCLLIALCESAGKRTTDKKKFDEIAKKMRESIGID